MEFLTNGYLTFFIIVAIGIGIGNIKIKGISLDTSAIIFVALIFGHFGAKVPPIIQQIGLIFFIYSVGIQAGPGFFDSFKKQGFSLISMAIIVILSGAVVTIGFKYLFDIPVDLAVGIYTGALTSTPGLAAVIEATHSPVASIGYGIAYPFGVLGVILFVKLIHKVFKVKISDEEEKYNNEIAADFPTPVNKNFIVENPNVFGKTIEELNIRVMTGTNISRVFHDGETRTPTLETVLHAGDIIKAVGSLEDLAKIKILIGNETEKLIPLGKRFLVKSLLVSNKEVVNKSFSELSLFTKYNATATSIRRAGIDIAPNAHTKIRFGDKIVVACGEDDLGEVSKLFGDNRKQLLELDFLPISIGILVGILLGHLKFPIAGFDFSLGLTGGVLVSALVLSKIGKTGSMLWNVSGSSNQLIRKLGLIFFLTAVGTHAGENLVTTINQNGSQLFIVGAFVTFIPMLIAILVGHYIFKINFLTLLGALTGSMTSTPALSGLDSLSNSNAPKIAYATVYPFALVMIIIVSQVIATFF